MAEVSPPLFMDVSSAYSGDELGLPHRDFATEGILSAGALAVTAGTGNSVNVAAGAAYVLGDTNPDLQPNYRVRNDAPVNKGITPDASNPRYVIIVAQVVDEAFTGTGRLWRIDAVHGTPAASPVVPATPASALKLADILVPAAAASSAAYTITDRRTRAFEGMPLPIVRIHGSAFTTGALTTAPITSENDTVGIGRVVSGDFVIDLAGIYLILPAMESINMGAGTSAGAYLKHNPAGANTTIALAQPSAGLQTAGQNRYLAGPPNVFGLAVGDVLRLQVDHSETGSNRQVGGYVTLIRLSA